jgi:hypothetical protein
VTIGDRSIASVSFRLNALSLLASGVSANLAEHKAVTARPNRPWLAHIRLRRRLIIAGKFSSVPASFANSPTSFAVQGLLLFAGLSIQ